MEREPFDNYDFRVLPRFTEVAKAIGHNICHFLSPLPTETFSSHGNHFRSHADNRGAEQFMADMLDQEDEAYKQGQLNFGFDDMGNYITGWED